MSAVPETKKQRTRTATSRNGAKPKRVKRLDLGCGKNKQDGFFGIDMSPNSDADLVWDLWETPWPIAANCVEEVFCSHVVEHIPHWRPGWELDGWWRFFDELWRVMKNEATGEFIHPYAMSARAFWDPTHTRYVHDMTWHYLNREWREANGLDHYCGECDFEIVTLSLLGVQDDYLSRNIEQQTFSRNHYWNVVPDLGVLIKARK